MNRPAERSASKRTQSARHLVQFVTRGHERAIATIAVTAFLGGLCEALFLVTMTRTAFAIKDGQDGVGIVSGSSLSIRLVLLLGVMLIAVRIALAGFSSWQAATVATRVVARLRHRLTDAFLKASWEVQQAQRSGSLQELLTSYSNKSAGLMSSLTAGVVAAANLVALIGMAVGVDPVGALVMVVSVTGLGLLLRPLRSLVRRRSGASSHAGMEFAISVNEISELG
ncbi:MAG: hypothetical protein ACREA0_29885, partial [bacterium]